MEQAVVSSCLGKLSYGSSSASSLLGISGSSLSVLLLLLLSSTWSSQDAVTTGAAAMAASADDKADDDEDALVAVDRAGELRADGAQEAAPDGHPNRLHQRRLIARRWQRSPDRRLTAVRASVVGLT